MMNLAGPSFDFGNVLFTVLQECEHRRGSLSDESAENDLREIARRKLEAMHRTYSECAGTPAYWREVEHEVLETALPRYVHAAIEQTRLERNHYDLWRGGDLASRLLWGLLGLVIGGIIIEVPFIPIFWKPFAFITAGSGFIYPELKRMAFDFRHSRLLNRLVRGGEKYQKNRIDFVTNEEVDEALASMGMLHSGDSMTDPKLENQIERKDPVKRS